MKRPDGSIKLILLAVALALLGYGLYLSIEFYEETVETRWSREALRNPYLAAQQFMTRSGIDVVDADSLLELESLDGVGTLFVSEANQVVTPRQLRELRSWLEAGGSVIYTADAVEHEDDLLLAAFDVSVEWYSEDDDGDEPSLSETIREYNRQLEQGKSREEILGDTAFAGTDKARNLTTVEFGGNIGDLVIHFRDRRILAHPYIDGSGHDPDKPQPVSWAYSDHGIHLMQFEVGTGLLTIISDPSIWTSYRIDRHDHAYLLWVLADDRGAFAFLRPVLQDSLWSLLARHATELLIATGLLVLLWLWHQAHRFGRVVPRDASRTRALAEHFSSLSHYLWHRRQGDYLITPLRQRVLRRASLRLGEFARADESRQMQLLAERAGVRAEAVASAMNIDDFTEATFVQKVRLLKRIEQSL